jgi:hypothetical protein
LEEVGVGTEHEDEFWCKNSDGREKDARWMRLASRHGYKIVIDDRGSSITKSEDDETERGNGVLIKGRRTAGAGGDWLLLKQGVEKQLPLSEEDEGQLEPRGFYWEFNENEQINQTSWGTPLGLGIQMSDKLQCLALMAPVRGYAMPYRGLEENEFLRKPMVDGYAEKACHHLMLDHQNEMIRLKTRSGTGDNPIGTPVLNPATKGEQQGVEFHDGSKGDGPWAELVDIERRGVWFSKDSGVSVLRSKTSEEGQCSTLLWMSEAKAEAVLHNSSSGYYVPAEDPADPPTFKSAKIQIYCKQDVEIIAENGSIKIKAQDEISMIAGRRIIMNGGGVKMELGGGNPKFSNVIIAPEIRKTTPNITPGKIPERSAMPKIQPTDRGERYNGSLSAEAALEEVEHIIDIDTEE